MRHQIELAAIEAQVLRGRGFQAHQNHIAISRSAAEVRKILRRCALEPRGSPIGRGTGMCGRPGQSAAQDRRDHIAAEPQSLHARRRHGS